MNRLANFRISIESSLNRIAQFDRCLAEDRSFTRGWINSGIAFARLGRFAEATARLEQALALEPDNRAAQENLHWVRSLAVTSTK